MTETATASWFSLALDALRLGAEAQAVVGLRLTKLAAGDLAAAEEAHLMVAEKLQAMAEVPVQMMVSVLSGAAHEAPGRAMAYCLTRVADNRRRLLDRG